MRRLAALALTSIVLSACEGAGLARVAPRLEVTPEPIVAAPTSIGARSTAAARLANVGELPLEVSALEVEGTDEWSVDAPSPLGSVAPGESRPLTLTFAPQGAVRAATLIVRSSDPERPVVRVPLEGTLRPGPAIVLCVERGGEDTRCSDTTDSVDLGVVRVGQVVSATVTVRSVGDAPVEVESLSLTAGLGSLSLSPGNGPITLAPGASLSRSLRYAPTMGGALMGRLEARPRGRSADLASLAILARAELPATLCADPARVDFGSVPVGAAPVANLKLTACSGGPVTIQSLGLTPAGAAFALVNPFVGPATLTPNGVLLSVDLRFSPSLAERFAGVLRVETDVGPLEVPLVGAGATTPEPSPTPSPSPSPSPSPPATCRPGSPAPSWRDTLPSVTPSAPGSTLAPSAGAAAGTCLGEASVTTDPTTADWVSTSLSHRSGKWYFEVTVEQVMSGRPLVGLFAPPADAWTLIFLPAPFMREVSAAATAPPGRGVVSVAADLDAGVVSFYFDGQRTGQSSVLSIPGVGAFRAAARAELGDRLKLNFGADPFAFGIPVGFAPWNGGVTTGACVSDPDLAAPPAPVGITCAGGAPCGGVTTFQTDANASPELIILGHYEAGSVSSWTWGTDANGDTRPVTVGPGMNGSATVDLDRPGRPITLVLSSYEPTDWTLRVAPGTQLASVSLYGMHLQTVTGVPAGAPVDARTICTGGDGGNCPGFTGLRFPIAPHRWPFDTGGGDTQGFVGEVEARFCLPMKLFAGAYTARGYVVR